MTEKSEDVKGESSVGVEADTRDGRQRAGRLQDQPLNASTVAQAAMGKRGRDRKNGRAAAIGEEGVLITTSSTSPPEDEVKKQKKKKKGSFWRSRGMVLFVVFMALLLDETLMTVIVPIVPDYLLNHCIQERCAELNTSTPKCQAMDAQGASSNMDSTSAMAPSTDSFGVMWTPPTFSASPVHVASATPTVGGSTEYSVTGFADDAFATSLPPSTTVGVSDDVTNTSNTTSDLTTPNVDATVPGAPSFEDECQVDIVPKTGILFASKFIVRIALSPLIGSFAHKIGFALLLLSGCVIMIASSLVFAFGVSYEALLTARIIHGFGATLNEIGGLGLLAYKYRNDEQKRGFALGLAIGGFAAGTLIGPPLGGICYDFLGKESPFLIMVGFFVALGVLELAALNPCTKHRQVVKKETPLYKLVLDPYILGAAGALMIASGVVALLEPTLPIWMRHNIHPPPDAWQLGAVFLPSGVSYIISSTIMGYLGYKIGRWSLSMFALVALAASVAAVPYTGTFVELIGPMVGTGFGFGTVDTAMTAMLNSRVDVRHKGAYGGAAAISTFAFCLGFAIGPSVSGFLTNAIGFKWLMRGIAVITIIYAPICIALRRPGNANQNAANNNNNGLTSGSRTDDVMDDQEVIPIPAISRRLSRV
ncbi:synaptic vesicular amine transporter-like [Patiria miniata]|uniref:Major facilitator superfamily (MFS) profile domain-containing protein n=1 Tax=Patiria miniata TaxID=46514 RepID=A0A914BQN5_PATMI|nr:synaptic vesicular amine transporter-like [Patiria miniata]